jgi:hypothetical protein
MDLFVLNETFQREVVVDEYMSLIWTERYSKNGDMQLVLPATPERKTLLSEGTFLGLLGSDEPMMIETQSIDSGMMTIVGKTLETFFNEREIWISTDPAVQNWILRSSPGAILGSIVQEMVVSGAFLSNAGLGIGATLNQIPNLTVGDIDTTDPVVSIAIPIGPMYDAMLPIAQTYNLGMKVYLDHSDAFSYGLKFTVWHGIDRTSDQFEVPTVQFSSALDSMSSTSELSSNSGYKTAAYVFPPDWSSGTAPVHAFAPGTDPAATGFDRRLLVLRASDISSDMVGGGVTLTSLMTQAANDALANNNFTKVVDGEVVPQTQYKYGVDYNLGDFIELKGEDNVVLVANVTEYIRSKDATGERAYPTVSVI